jgi:putative ABC transport system ATP-binding protein
MIVLQNITKTYNYQKPNAFEALHDVSLTIGQGEMVAIIGKSGSGKSTLLHILSCADGFEKGSYLLEGEEISKCSEAKAALLRNEKLGIVVQDFALVEQYTVLENVMLPFYFDRSTNLKTARAKAEEVLVRMEMQSMLHKPVNKLSGGQKQRVAIARAIVKQPNLILADEPTGALDSRTAADIMRIFHQLHEQGKTIVIVTHDGEIAAQCSRVIEIADGRIV